MKQLSEVSLKELSDEQLKKTFLDLRYQINKSKRLKKDSKDLEVYYCYVIREMEARDRSRGCVGN